MEGASPFSLEEEGEEGGGSMVGKGGGGRSEISARSVDIGGWRDCDEDKAGQDARAF